MRMTQVLTAVVASIAVAAAALLAAEPPAGEGRRGGRGRMDGVATYLGLTDEQKAQLADQREKTRPQMEGNFFREDAGQPRKAARGTRGSGARPGGGGCDRHPGAHAGAPDEGAARGAREGARAMLSRSTRRSSTRSRRCARAGRGERLEGWMGMVDALGPPPQDDMGRSGRSGEPDAPPMPLQQ